MFSYFENSFIRWKERRKIIFQRVEKQFYSSDENQRNIGTYVLKNKQWRQLLKNIRKNKKIE